jgi:hypothetical protein
VKRWTVDYVVVDEPKLKSFEDGEIMRLQPVFNENGRGITQAEFERGLYAYLQGTGIQGLYRDQAERGAFEAKPLCSP